MYTMCTQPPDRIQATACDWWLERLGSTRGQPCPPHLYLLGNMYKIVRHLIYILCPQASRSASLPDSLITHFSPRPPGKPVIVYSRPCLQMEEPPEDEIEHCDVREKRRWHYGWLFILTSNRHAYTAKVYHGEKATHVCAM